MARQTDPVCRLCRREGIKLFLKGSRCESPKCAIERRDVLPACTAIAAARPSEYGMRLREKQKLKRFYGVLERQFRRYFELASRSTENTGEVLLTHHGATARQYRLPAGLGAGRAAARQMVTHGHDSAQRPKLATSRACWSGPATRSRVKSRRAAAATGQACTLQSNNPPQPPDYLERDCAEPPRRQGAAPADARRCRSQHPEHSRTTDHRSSARVNQPQSCSPASGDPAIRVSRLRRRLRDSVTETRICEFDGVAWNCRTASLIDRGTT